MLIREFTPSLSSPGTLGTGSSHKPHTAIFPSYGSPMLDAGIDIRTVRDYSRFYEDPEYDYGRAMAHFYGFKELSPQGESSLGSGTIDADLEGEMYVQFSFDMGSFDCSSVRRCGLGDVFLPRTCVAGDIEAVGHANRPYLYSPPKAPLSQAGWAGDEEKTGIQNLDLGQGAYFGFAQYYTVEPGAGPKSGENFLDNSQEHPLLLINGAWQDGSTAETTIGSTLLYDPDNFQFTAAGTQDLTEGHAWEDDFDGTPVTDDTTNELYFYMRSWPDIANLSTGYAHLTKVPEANGYDDMTMSFYMLTKTLTVRKSGSYPAAEAATRALSYTQFRLHYDYANRYPQIMPWGDVNSKAAGDPPDYSISDDYPDVGCRSLNNDLEPDAGSEIVVCEELTPILGFALYVKLDETALSFTDKFGFSYSSNYSGPLAWPNLVGALHEYEFDEDEGEWYMPLLCSGTPFAVSTSGVGNETSEYLFDNDPAAAFTKAFTCGLDGYGVIWPTDDNPAEVPNTGPPPAWGCDDGFYLANDACNWPFYGDGRTNIKMVTEENERTWDFLEVDAYDHMLTKSSLLASKSCTRSNTLAWYYCACRCDDCGDFFFFDMEFLSYLFGGTPPVCGEEGFNPEGVIETTVSNAEQEVNVTDTTVFPGWWRLEIDVTPFYAPLNNLVSYWGDPDLPLADDVCFPNEISGVYALGDVSLVLKNTDTDREGLVELDGFNIGTPAKDGSPSADWQATLLPKLPINYICDDTYTEEDVCIEGTYANLWRSSILTHLELAFEDPHESPLEDLEPNGAWWELTKIKIAAGEGSVDCGPNGEMYDAICFSSLYGPMMDVCSSDDEIVGLGCLDEDFYCRPTAGRETADSLSESLEYDLIAYFRGIA